MCHADIGKDYALSIHVYDKGTQKGIDKAVIRLSVDFMDYVFGKTDSNGDYTDNLLLLYDASPGQKEPDPKGTLTISADGYETSVIHLWEQEIKDGSIYVEVGMKSTAL